VARYHWASCHGSGAKVVERNPTVMKETRNAADSVLAHSEDEGEWEDGPEQIESRPSGTQVISARLPTVLAEHLLAEASNRGIRPSELVRQAVEVYMRSAVGRVASVPSGPLPTMSDLLGITDVVVMGTIGNPRSYVSEDQRDVYTDYPINNAVFIYQKQPTATQTPGTLPGVTVTQLGGTVTVNGTKFTQKEPALLPLQSGTQGLFLLQRIGTKYQITRVYYGAFRIVDGVLLPLMARKDFLPEYRNMTVSAAVTSIRAILQNHTNSPQR